VCAAEAGCADAAADASPADATADASPADAATKDAEIRPDLGPLADAAPPDADLDATPVDAGVDAAPADAASVDTGVDAAPDAAGDGALPNDGGPPPDAADAGPTPDGNPTPSAINLTGTYAVTRTVRLSGSPDFRVGDRVHTIERLTRVGRPSTYRLEIFDLDGNLVTTIDHLDVLFPEGRRDYEIHYGLDDPQAPAGCTRHDDLFERGQVVGDEPPRTLDGQLDLDAAFAGDECRAQDFLVRFAVEWRPVSP
jgi:hypothetical protein